MRVGKLSVYVVPLIEVVVKHTCIKNSRLVGRVRGESGGESVDRR